MFCQATNGPPKNGSPGSSTVDFLLWVVPQTTYGYNRWSHQTIYGAISGPSLLHMFPEYGQYYIELYCSTKFARLKFQNP